jgi:stearoyl-CoA desaturase (delta-9 desaturase)
MMEKTRAIIATERKPVKQQAVLLIVVIVPFAAVLTAVPFARALGISWSIALLGMALYAISMLGITAGFHRLFAHRAFRASRGWKIGLAVAGSFAIQGPVLQWTADHRRHHAFSDQAGDPHSPWRYGTGFWALARGMFFAHVGWLFDFEETNQALFVPDLMKDADIVLVSRLFGVLAAIGTFLPSAVELAFGASWFRALEALFWAGLVRIFLVHHVTWSVNSVCHVFGRRPFMTRDRSANVWPLAILSMGESWHNGHHSMPYSARHGLLRGQIDLAAMLIRCLELGGRATKVRWPRPEDVAGALVRRNGAAD